MIHVQLEAARAVIATDPDRGLLAINRAQALAKDGLTAVRQSVKALREDSRVEGIAEQLASLVDAVRDESFTATFTTTGTPRPVTAGGRARAAPHGARGADQRAPPRRGHAIVDMVLAFRADGRVHLRVHDDGRGAAAWTAASA